MTSARPDTARNRCRSGDRRGPLMAKKRREMWTRCGPTADLKINF
jgi:hypothetical protein